MTDGFPVSKENNESFICCICGATARGYGNNPHPIKKEGKCCDFCNQKVIIERLKQYKEEK